MKPAGATLDSHGSEFEERNLLLQLALGLVSASRRLDSLLARHVGNGAKAAAAPGDEALIDFLLGVITFRDRVMRHLNAARIVGKARGIRDDIPPPPEGLLR